MGFGSISKTRLAIMVSLATVIVISGIVILRALYSTRTSPVQRIYESTRAPFEELSMQALDSREAVRGALSNMTWENGDVATDIQKRSLLRLLEDAVTFYYVENVPDPYKKWRQSQGCQFRKLEAMLEPFGWPIEIMITFIEASPEGKSIGFDFSGDAEAVFDEIWRVSRIVYGGGNRAEKICNSTAGLATRFATGHPEKTPPPILESGIGRDAWYGGTALSSRSWFHCEGEEQSRGGHSDKLIATSGIVFEFGDGLRRPVHFVTFWDDIVQTWRLHVIVMTNRPARHPTWPWEM